MEEVPKTPFEEEEEKTSETPITSPIEEEEEKTSETPITSPIEKEEEKTSEIPLTSPIVEEPLIPPPAEPIVREHDVTLPIVGKRIIVDFSEKEECVLGPNSEVIFYEGSAVLSVENPCVSESIWNINVDLSQTEGTVDLRSGNYLANDLDGGNEWKKPYKLMSASPVLQIIEQVDTDYQEGEDPIFDRNELIAGVETSTIFQLTLTNRHQKSINKITLTKELPKEFTIPPRFLPPYLGEVEYDANQGKLTWTLTNLESDSPATLSIVATCTPTNVEPVQTGMIDVEYEVHGSNIVPIQPFVKSLCDVFFFVETAESDEPGQWHCTAEFEGNSELQTHLESVKISNDETTIFSAKPNEDIPAKSSWTADF